MKAFPTSALAVIIGLGWLATPRQALAQDKENPFPYGKAETEGKRVDDVVALLRIADRYRGECARARETGEGLALVKHYGREAKNWYRLALDREPSNAYACLSIGYTDLIIGRATSDLSARQDSLSSAMSRFREALEKRQGYAEAYLFIAQVHALRGENKQAQDNLELILNSGIESSQVHTWMAYVLTQAKQKDQAAKHVARAIELDDPSASAQWARSIK